MIWGFGVDESLTEGQEVKFTVIATGFGIEAIPELEEWKDESWLLQKQAEINRVIQVYGEKSNLNIDVNRVTDKSIVILTPDEMDNDEFINFLEKNPTYSRKESDIKKIRKPAKVAVTKDEPKCVEEKIDSEEDPLIVF